MKPLLLLLSAVCYAQTTFSTQQIKATPSAALQILAFTADGKPALLTLGPGLGISNGQIVVMATAIPSVAVVATQLTPSSDGSYAIPPAAALITRNGQVMQPGRDYNIDAGRLIPLYPWSAVDDIVQYAWRVNGTPAGFP